ncbi:MAG: DNA topoisomerase (ATP-hydrolyzing) subunit B [Flavobacteriales bacterium]|jgi:DNA gyrase subunit B|uniref:DNA topoisomerase (ATP-hydrolyzing) subunit B n=1 Tax=Blattabacterium sp. (Mastotermes darwiniensis) TaxID=39768 RepID=UPI000231DF86|nr:DNA topoisomerase (ATP-hydrolyzing) subunit B [Blattabacterium sp. (Mastotermes darwiniensis)]AER40414.1 DNA gyrase subunit B [Blattabacterium sp. (Mastotermes darwiniensis) str. MADAR]MDR1804863.1 DNA topoisomerase (ATP-hydrolyzing) subunit B [Flavobacteriales bacterium]
MRKSETKDYTADSIQSLEGIEHIRIRPSMYIGDVGIRGLHHLAYEVIDNSVDESLAGFCDKIWVTIHKDGFITVLDNGRGIPIDIHKKEGKSALEVVMTKIGAGGKFDKNSYKVSGGLHGVGISCVNALSRTLIVTIYRNGKVYQQEYFKGKALYDVKCLGRTNNKGTKIHYLADHSIFSSITYDYDILSKRLKELSFLNKGLHLFLKDERNKKKEYFSSKNGLKEYLSILDKNKDTLTKNIISIEGERESTIVEIAMQYNTSFKEKIYSYVNNIHTYDGGTHISGFRRALTRTLKKYADVYGSLSNKDKKIELTGDDFREGITAIISVRVMEPQFEGQTKTKLSNHEVGGVVEKIVGERLNIYLEEHPSDRKKIIEKVILSAKARQAAKKAREFIQKNNPIHNSFLPGKLADCSFNKPEDCEIYLVEGDSAGGTAKQGRDRKFQAILPLRGKILNVEKAVQYKIFENEEIRNIFTSLGVSIETENNQNNLNIKKLRYNKIIIMTDADIDGSHISTLILTLFFRYMKPLIEKGHIYIATPPLYLIRKGNRFQYYAWSDQERENILHQLGGRKNVNVQRYKGLGEMNAEQLWDTTMNPKKRTLRKVNIENLSKADKIFSILMGDEVPPRRNFIEKNAIHAKIDV